MIRLFRTLRWVSDADPIGVSIGLAVAIVPTMIRMADIDFAAGALAHTGHTGHTGQAVLLLLGRL
ncbi:MAG: hypothetical protein CSA74_06215 [Rhodobacterales bacterium]|nr:MAG: hypothetical protein CSA74_06215 [Rhodobacterales bacterium]